MRPRERAAAGAAACCALVLTGCGEQSPLDPRSEPAREIARLWWVMLAAGAVVFLGAVGLLVLSAARRRRGFPLIGQNERFNTGLVLVFGIGIPVAALVPLFVVANFAVLGDTDSPEPGTGRITIDVVGHQWFWEARYRGTSAVTANEIHIPTKTPVTISATTSDVIHSFWVPRLNRKIDMIPGRRNRITLEADRPGRYRGQCAEFCGLQHAHMALVVVAQPEPAFRAWLANMARPRRAPQTASERRGEQVFLTQPCSACHAIRGTRAAGDVGPDLTHLATRESLAAVTIPNRREELARWIADPQHVKPGNRMPALGLTRPQLEALLDYLESLR